jgi:hypothetical protein
MSGDHNMYQKDIPIKRRRGPNKNPTLVHTNIRYPREVIEYFMHNGEGSSCHIRMRNVLIEYVKEKTNANPRVEGQEESSRPTEAV